MIIPSGFFQATFLYSGSVLPFGAANTLGLHQTGALTLQQIAEQLVDDWEAQVMPELSSAMQFDGVILKAGPNSTGAQHVATSTQIGGKAGQSQTPNTAWLVRKNTAAGGRKNRGRLYIPGLVEADVNGLGSIGSTAVASMQDAIEGFVAAMATAELFPDLLHSDTGDEPTPITSMVVDSLAATQRRRMRQ